MAMDAETRTIWLAHVRFRAYCRLEGIADPEKQLLKSDDGLKAFRAWLEPMWTRFRALKRCEAAAAGEQQLFDAWLLELSPEGEAPRTKPAAPAARAKQGSLFG